MEVDEKDRIIRIFIASPSDLAEERREFKKAIDELNKGFAAGANTQLEALAWEETLSIVGARPQSIINQKVDACDCFILALHKRWGQKATGSQYSSHTEEEYNRALARFKDSGRPRIFIFLKNIDAAFMTDPGPQLRKVLAFRRSLERSGTALHHSFNDVSDFRRELDSHLQALIKGKLPNLEGPRDSVGLPLDAMERVQAAEREAERLRKEAEEAKKEVAAQHLQLEGARLLLARKAATAAREGRTEEARQGFAEVTEATNNLDVLALAGQFYYEINELARAEELLRRALSFTQPGDVNAQIAASCQTLGLVCLRRGDTAQAEAFQQRALEVFEKLGDTNLIARHYRKLESAYRDQGDSGKADQTRNKASEVDQKLGRKVSRTEAVPNLMIPDNNPMGLVNTIAIGVSGVIQSIAVTVDIVHTYVGDLIVELLTPRGNTLTLRNRAGGAADNLVATYTDDSLPALGTLIGEEVRGNWSLRVRDLSAQDVGKLLKWGLEFRYTER